MTTRLLTTIAAFLFLLSASQVSGQVEEQKIDENIFGVLVGGTLSNISNYDADSRAGFQAGLYWEWRFSEDFSTLPNITFAQRGANGSSDLPNVRLSYFTFPLQLKYSISSAVSVASGIAWDLLISASGDGVDSDDFKDDDLRIPIIVGYNVSDKLSIGVAYNFGLTDITENDDATNRNNWGSLSLAYKVF